MMIKRAIPLACRLSNLNRKLAPACVRLYSSADHPPSNYVYPSMDELPVPCGDWNEDYCNKQRKYNVHLIFGTGLFVITLAVGYYSGLFWCNMFPPEKPGPRREPVC